MANNGRQNVARWMLVATIAFVLCGCSPDLGHDKPVAQPITCVNNLKQIGLAFKTWALDHGDQYPFNVSTNQGGTIELCRIGMDGFDMNAVHHLQVMYKELSTPRILVCPKDHSKKPAVGFHALRPENLTYRLVTGTNITDNYPQQQIMVCPIDGNALYCDGSVTVTNTSEYPSGQLHVP